MPTSDKERARIRDNQRRLRAKRKEYQQELEQRLSLYHRQGIAASTEVQAAARKVASENKMLRTLLNKHGVNNDNIEAYLQSSADTTAVTLPPASLTDPSAAETLEALFVAHRPKCLGPDAASCLEPGKPTEDGGTEPEQEPSPACIAATRSPWDASPAAQTGAFVRPLVATSIASTNETDATILPVNLTLSSFAEDTASLQAFVFDAAGQILQSTSQALDTSITQHAQQQKPLASMQGAPATMQPPASLLRAAEDPSLLTSAEEVLDGSPREMGFGIPRHTNQNEAETQYRNQLNLEYELLLAALHGTGGWRTDENGCVNKAEVLDSALRHIHVLEADNKKLQAEQKVLLENLGVMQRTV